MSADPGLTTDSPAIQEGTQVAPRSGDRAGVPRKRKPTPALSDPVIRYLAIGAAVVVVLWLATMTSAIVFGLTDRPAPRTYVERQIDMLEGEVRKSPKVEVGWADYAAALITAKQYAKAEEIIKRGLKVASTKAMLLTQRARLYQAQGDLDLALKYANEAVKTGRAEMKATEEAAMERSGTRADAEDAGVRGGLIIQYEVLEERKDWKGVVKSATGLIKLDSTDAEAYAVRGDAYRELRQNKKAEKDYREALKYIPDMPAAVDGLEALGVTSK